MIHTSIWLSGNKDYIHKLVSTRIHHNKKEHKGRGPSYGHILITLMKKLNPTTSQHFTHIYPNHIQIKADKGKSCIIIRKKNKKNLNYTKIGKLKFRMKQRNIKPNQLLQQQAGDKTRKRTNKESEEVYLFQGSELGRDKGETTSPPLKYDSENLDEQSRVKWEQEFDSQSL